LKYTAKKNNPKTNQPNNNGNNMDKWGLLKYNLWKGKKM
jgi:hypothetical protein